jgi:hypothetical protein
MLLLTCADLEILALKLFGALQNLSTVNYLLSSTRRENLLYSLVVLSSLVVSGGINVDSVIPIFQRVIKHAPDDDVWNAALALAASQAAPPTIPSKAALDTPLKSTSSSQQGSEQTSDDVQSIFYEICDCVYTNTKGFYEKYFEGKSWSSTVEEFVDATNLEMTDCCWTEHPNPPSQEAVLDWLRAFQARFLPGRRGTFYPSHSKPLNGSNCKRQPDLFLAPFGTEKYGKYDRADVQVIGELKQSDNLNEFQRDLLCLYGYAREVFQYQPTRRFLHGFFIRGSMVELWVFDRSGLYGCEKFDIHKDPHRFIRVMIGYIMMSDEEWGINIYVNEDKAGKYIILKGEDETKEEKLYL